MRQKASIVQSAKSRNKLAPGQIASSTENYYRSGTEGFLHNSYPPLDSICRKQPSGSGRNSDFAEFLISEESFEASVVSFFALDREKTAGNLAHFAVISHAITAFMPF